MAVPPFGDMMPDVAWGTAQSMTEWARNYDFAVKIRRTVSGGRCSGTLLGNKVLTAAHCLLPVGGGAALGAAEFRVDSINAAGTAVVTTTVTGRRVHPKYTHGSQDYDFGILTLSAVVPTTVPIRLQSTPTPNGQKLRIAGFGQTAPEDPNPAAPAQPIVSTRMIVHDCPSDFAKANHKTECLSSPTSLKSASCAGDSGGGWFVWDKTTAVIAGVNSAGYGGACESVHKAGHRPDICGQGVDPEVGPRLHVDLRRPVIRPGKGGRWSQRRSTQSMA